MQLTLIPHAREAKKGGSAIPSPSSIGAQIQPILTSFDEQLLMGSLPFPPKNSAPFFWPSQSPQDLVVLESPPYVHSTLFKTTSSRDEWEDLPGHTSPTVPSQAYMLSAEVSLQAQAPFSSKTPHSRHPYLKSWRLRILAPLDLSRHLAWFPPELTVWDIDALDHYLTS
ncbi:hypothetical protein BU15DRAFT_74668 [Melanogaster broomeanus]|nr:hypothetical protein BU15DRAFT_74668 [Melanogaster broomeanus]